MKKENSQIKYICLKQFYLLTDERGRKEKAGVRRRRVDFDILNSDTHNQATFFFFNCPYTFLQNTNLRKDYFESIISETKQDYFIILPNTKKKKTAVNPQNTKHPSLLLNE